MPGLLQLLLSASMSAAQPAQAAALPPVHTITAAEQREDLAALKFTLERSHPNFYRYLGKAQADDLFKSAERSVKGPTSDLEFYRRLAPLVTAIRDSHTSIEPPEELLRYFRSGGRAGFPLLVQYVDGRAYAVADLSSSHAVAPDSEILAIDGHSMKEVTDRLITLVSVDGYNRPSQLDRLSNGFWYYYGVGFGPETHYRVRLRSISGAISEQVLAGAQARQIFERQSGPPHKSQNLEVGSDGVAVLTLDQLSDPSTGAFLDDTFRKIAEAKVQDLIIDLRNCPGGDDRFNNQLFSYLVDHPFRFYWNRTFTVRSYDDLKYVDYTADDFLTPEQIQALPPDERRDPLATMSLPQLLTYMLSVDGADGTFQPAVANRFHGRLYFLFSGKSSSSAAEIAALAHHLGLGTSIGEEPNGVYQGLTAGALLLLKLPHSGVRVHLPIIAYHNAVVANAFGGRAAPPAFPLSESLADAAAGDDTVMKFTRSLIDARRLRQSPATQASSPAQRGGLKR